METRTRKTATATAFALLLVSSVAAAPLSIEVKKLLGANLTQRSTVEAASEPRVTEAGDQRLLSVLSAEDSDGIIQPGEELKAKIDATVSCFDGYTLCSAEYWIEVNGNRYFADGNPYYFSDGETKTITITGFTAPSDTGSYLVYWVSGDENQPSEGTAFDSDTLTVVQDSDGDGVADRNDKCRNEDGQQRYNGCPPPDFDGDGIPDPEDECPEKGRNIQFTDVRDGLKDNGCPITDSDGDDIPGVNDNCPETAGSESTDGCPDTDGDGVKDSRDSCRTRGDQGFGLKDNGCPIQDTDGDGVPDPDDECRNTRGEEAFNGCRDPDPDGDGVTRDQDECPDTAGNLPNGCQNTNPEIQNFIVSKPTVTVGEQLTAEVSVFDPDNQQIQYSWRIPDSRGGGATGSGKVSFSFKNAGTKTISVEVSDGIATDSKSQTVTVEPKEAETITVYTPTSQGTCTQRQVKPSNRPGNSFDTKQACLDSITQTDPGGTDPGNGSDSGDGTGRSDGTGGGDRRDDDGSNTGEQLGPVEKIWFQFIDLVGGLL